MARLGNRQGVKKEPQLFFTIFLGVFPPLFSPFSLLFVSRCGGGGVWRWGCRHDISQEPRLFLTFCLGCFSCEGEELAGVVCGGGRGWG